MLEDEVPNASSSKLSNSEDGLEVDEYVSLLSLLKNPILLSAYLGFDELLLVLLGLASSEESFSVSVL